MGNYDERKFSITQPENIDAECVIFYEGDDFVFQRFATIGIDEEGNMVCLTALEPLTLYKAAQLLNKVTKESLKRAPKDVRNSVEADILLDSLNKDDWINQEDDDDGKNGVQ